jgi:hypothetical protein
MSERPAGSFDPVLVGGGAGAVTEIAALPDLPLEVAVIVAEPAATPVTTPLMLTLATAELLEAQLMD